MTQPVTSRSILRRLIAPLLFAAAAASPLTAGTEQQQPPPTAPPATQTQPERFSALAIPARADYQATTVDFVITRWSTPAEHDKLMNALAELGPKGFVKALSDLPRVGGFGGPGAAGYPIRYAWKSTGRDGRERITMATDRDAAFWEVANRTRSLDYPVTWIEMTLRPSGEGDGQVSVAAKVAIDRPTKTIIVENYDINPVRLTAVKRLK